MDKEEFEADHKIDPLQLDVEVARQPELFYKWAERLIEARAAVDEAKIGIDKAKFQWDTSEAKLALEIRANPGDFGLDKVTEGTITAAVKDHKKYKKARQKWIDAKANADATTARAGKLEQAVKTMEMKKRMLESLITLHGQQYFAGPSTPRDLPAAWLAQKAAAEEASHKRQVSVTRKRKKKAK